MNFCVIGGGVSGALLNNVLTRQGHNLTVFDKSSFQMRSGFGFLILPNGVKGLKELGVWKFVEPYCKRIRKVNYYNTSGDLSNQIDFEEVYSISRFNFLQALNEGSTAPIEDIVHLTEDRKFIVGDHTRLDASSFDGILGTDGVHSQTRALLNPNVENQETCTYEVMGVVQSDFLYNMMDSELYKYAIKDTGLSLGILPLNDGEIIWFLQVNSIDHGTPLRDKHSLTAFLKEKVGDSENPMIQALLNANIDSTYVWQGRTLKKMESFAQDNIFLFGDAAHLFLPFTSQGTNSAIEDVALFVSLLNSGKKLTEFSEAYSKKRLEETSPVVWSGIEMMHEFCFADFDLVSSKAPVVIIK